MTSEETDSSFSIYMEIYDSFLGITIYFTNIYVMENTWKHAKKYFFSVLIMKTIYILYMCI